MSVTAVVGLQWGDEAKGKIVDLLTDQHQVVCRYLGGNNAGHTVMFGGKTYKLSMLPAGILRPGVTSVISNGVVINPKALLAELDSIRKQGVEVGQLLISDRAHVIFPYHMIEEAGLEKARGAKAIGTTMRGIGTCYRDKIGRTHAIRLGDLYRPEFFKERLNEVVEQKRIVIHAVDPQAEIPSVESIFEDYTQYAAKLKEHVIDTTAYLHRILKEKKSLLFEGAQGSLLDIDHGTFPYVTSSNSSGCGIHPGSGVPERAIDRMIGVVKAYTTRVGGGPCPTELTNEIGQHIRDEGHEYGTVTGRPRRCGWFDAVATGYGSRISGIDCIAIMLLDVLSKLDEIKICHAYEINGERTTDFPSHIEDLAKAQPIYRTLPGWKKDITGIRKMADFPPAARQYIDTIAELLDAKVGFVSIGPDREQTVII
ncbi:adenylosuccinate synthase [Planctomicrobium piriforme]|uniref:Adenylosuccinate synthetase n=1 Tax=Planctomicrobium piriforme TaxID=1576369 RepID=A0A1I3MN01_9PLAN|nr:adenylosuccinate synthase [Planctomicrobium piriforme]SFI98046.1 adenylosuccinate synthase [Planctomicrobium piriforme]